MCSHSFPLVSRDDIFEAILVEQEEVGYYHLPDAPIEDILAFASKDTHAEIVVVGVGGSSLGTKAVYRFLKDATQGLKELHFLESTDPVSLLANIARIDLPNALFVVISKSGHTTETLSIYKYLLSLQTIEKTSLVVVTDEGSPLHKHALSENIRTFHLPSNVGGRFSVLSSVGLLPLALAGVDIHALLTGARAVKDAFFGDISVRNALIAKAVFYGQNHTRYTINTLFSYADGLKYLNEWYIQLWGESLGKIHPTRGNIGLTPIGIIGPVDQHSFLQLVVEGPRDKTMTFLQIRDFGTPVVVPDISLKHLESLDIFNTLPFGQLINLQAEAIIEQLSLLGIPLDTLELARIDPENIGALIFYYELLTSLVAQVLEVSPYDQPGVEDGKKILKQKVMAMHK